MNEFDELFSHLNDDERQRLKSICTQKNYEVGETLFYEGEESKRLHFLLSGSLRLFKTNAKGGEIVIHDAHAPCFVGELANFEHRTFPASARFVTKASVLKIDFDKFEEEFLRNPSVSYSIIKSLLMKLKILEGFITRELTQPAQAKVAEFLLKEPKIFETAKHNDVAQRLNLTPETLSRTLARFKLCGWISTEKKTVEILDRQALEELFAR